MDFESLMRDRELTNEIINSKDVSVLSSNPKSVRLKADKGCSLYGFIKLVDKIVKLTMPEARFEPDEGKVISLDAVTQFNKPIITYTVQYRAPKKEKKPVFRQSVTEDTLDKESERIGEIWAQKFECYVQFNVFASVYNQAEQVMEKFEETIIKHAGFFKRNGVAELFFKEHLTDSHFDTMRETLSVRNLVYYVEIEKQTVMFKEKINEIELIAQKQIDEEEI